MIEKKSKKWEKKKSKSTRGLERKKAGMQDRRTNSAGTSQDAPFFQSPNVEDGRIERKQTFWGSLKHRVVSNVRILLLFLTFEVRVISLVKVALSSIGKRVIREYVSPDGHAFIQLIKAIIAKRLGAYAG